MMSNTVFFGDLNLGADPATVSQIVTTALDLAKASITNNNTFEFQLVELPSTFNWLIAPVQSNGGTQNILFIATQGKIRFTLSSDSSAIDGDLNLVAVDDMEKPTVQVQYVGTLKGNFAKEVSY